MDNPQIGLYLKKILKEIEKELNNNLLELELTSMQANILMYLFKNRDRVINQRDIENKFNLTNPTVNGILNRLESKGFINRMTSKIDARNKEIHLTNKSIELNKRMINESNKIEDKIKNGISKEELDLFYIVINKMYENIKGGKE